MRNLEHQVAQMSKLLEERLSGTLPSNTVANPKESLKGVSLRSWKKLQDPVEKEHEPSVAEPVVISDTDNAPQNRTPVTEYQQKLPFSSKAKKDQQDEQYKKFIDMFKTLHINVPYVEALAQMPRYAKFLKELLTNKRKLEDVSSVTLSEECSALLCNNLPKKEKDPGGFIVPCTIGGLVDEKETFFRDELIDLLEDIVFDEDELGLAT
ncbi:uncharacterized protein LOC120282760 [Dioscorea cayenensis subsp. rotundata]|uniref:Uncharacterized protein LOC120282760 n=1 Tax=Dioscorea cayennensis subsp. rotundata TaxID=55577 RepID=A0AB40D5J9_DIOCR|nr:uncharacterized protein LOC120282760 [Dioscorea cayenensis subsp. rotundata]